MGQATKRRNRYVHDENVYLTNVDKTVMKYSRRPFKSTFQKNTIKGIVLHPNTNRYAYTFNEDDSYVDVTECEIIN